MFSFLNEHCRLIHASRKIASNATCSRSLMSSPVMRSHPGRARTNGKDTFSALSFFALLSLFLRDILACFRQTPPGERPPNGQYMGYSPVNCSISAWIEPEPGGMLGEPHTVKIHVPACKKDHFVAMLVLEVKLGGQAWYLFILRRVIDIHMEDELKSQRLE